MANIPVALQLYSIREDCTRDFPGCMAAVGKMGYAGVEFAGYYGRPASEVKKLLDENGLKTAGTHIGLDTLLGNDLQKTIEFNQEIGNRFLIVPGFSENRRNSRAAWLETAHLMNEIAGKLAPHGMYTGYHNHCIEFAPMDGELPWDTFFGNTRQEVVMQLDTGNALEGGADPTPFLSRYPGRALTVHLKEHSTSNPNALVGEGDINWPEIFSLCEGQGGTQWYIVEQETYAYPPLECVDRCLKNLKAMGKA